MPAPRLLVLQHIACEPPAAYEDELAAWGTGLVRVELDEGEPLPDWRGFAGLVVMGGPMGAYEEAEHAWLVPEKRLIREAASAGMPVWGVCLGAQLLAASLGARVYPGERAEVGVLPVALTAEAAADPVFGGAPAELQALQWHGDTFDLPPGATLLASSDAYPHQAFAWRRAYGLQFHLEVPPGLAGEWGAVPAYRASLEAHLGTDGLGRLLADLGDAAEMNGLARLLFGRWLGRVAGLPQPRPAPLVS